MGKRFLAISTLAVTSVFVILCAADSTYATGNSASVNFAANIVTNTTLSVDIDSVAGENVIVNLTPTPGTTAFQDSDDVAVTVTSNNRTGYYLMMSTSSENLTNTADDTLHISSLDPANTTGYTSSTFPANTWGYSTKTGNNYSNFFGVGNGVTLQNGNNPTQATSTVKFGIKVDSNLPSGVYTTSIVFTTIAKPALYMQDVAYWKDSIAIGESVQAIDSRDMKSYWVTRIKTDPAIPDSRAECTGTGASRVCSQLWMTQNLDLDLNTSTTFTHYDTDLGWTDGDTSVTWTPTAPTATSIDTVYSNLINNGISELSYSDSTEKFYYYNDDRHYGSFTLAECANLLGLNAADCYHLSAGNYYSGIVAIAGYAQKGDGTRYYSGDTPPPNYYANPNSVCPAGWKLPQGLSSASDYSDFDYLLYYNSVTADHGNTYILKDAEQDPDHYYPYVESVGYATHLYGDEDTQTDGHYNISAYPLWFTHAGAVYFSGDSSSASMYEPAERAGFFTSNSFYREDGEGYHSTGETSPASGIYHMHTCSDCVAPADIVNYYTLMSVRCIAR